MDAGDFEQLLEQAAEHRFEGWDFSFLGDRVRMEPVPWDYPGRIRELLASARSVADMGTGGGELFSTLGPFRALAIATEGWRPNVGVAARRLRPLGAHVVEVEGAPDNAEQRFMSNERGRLPFRSGILDLVVNRHEAFLAAEVARSLRPGGTFLTQQVGPHDEEELHELLEAPPPTAAPTVAGYVEQLERAGLRVVDAREGFPVKRYADVGAIAIFFLSAPWLLEGFTIESYRERLRRLHDRIAAQGPLVVRAHRYLLEASKPP